MALPASATPSPAAPSPDTCAPSPGGASSPAGPSSPDTLSPAAPSSPRPGPLDAGALVEASNGALATLASGLDVACLSGPDAAALYRALCAGTRRVVALKALLASRIETSGWFRDEGHGSTAAYLAFLEGTTDGEARRTLACGRALATLPGVEEAAREGKLSAPKLAEVTEVAAEHPEAEAALLSGIAERSLAEVVHRGRAVRQRRTGDDARARAARLWRRRFFAHHTDAEGAFCFRGRDTPERGARLLALLEAEVEALRAEEEDTTPERSDPTPRGALAADALYGLLTGTASSGSPPSTGSTGSTGSPTPEDTEDAGGPGRPHRAPPAPATLLVRVDLDALLRGEVERGGVCELAGIGPIPPPMAADLGNDALLRLIFHRAGDIRAVVHHTRTLNATLRTALEARDPTCVVPGCTMARNLEIDHVVPYVAGGPTSLANLARLCRRHHFLKTYEGWTLTRTNPDRDEAPTWAFTPLAPFGEEPGNRDDEGEGPALE